MLIYIHGFNSSPLSTKAQHLQRNLAPGEFAAPELPHRPVEAAAVLDALAAQYPGAALVGSSLGGYYATYLAEKHELRAVLVNPAVRPYVLLRSQVGIQKNFYTGREYEFTERHLE